MSVYPYRKHDGAWQRSTLFILIIIVILAAAYIFIWCSNPVNTDHSNAVTLALRYVEFMVKTFIEILFTTLILVAAVMYFLQHIGKNEFTIIRCFQHIPCGNQGIPR